MNDDDQHRLAHVLADAKVEAVRDERAAPRLETRHPLRPKRGLLLASRAADADPLSGHRGSGAGSQAVALLGEVVLACELVGEPTGPSLRGQLSGGCPEDLVGALVHVRTSAGPALGCAGPDGEVALLGLPSDDVTTLVVELEDAAWIVDDPFGLGRRGAAGR